MRKTFRIVYLLIMPLLFVALMAICLSFEGTMNIAASVNADESSNTINAAATATLDIKGVVFTLTSWPASLAKSLSYNVNILSRTITIENAAAESALTTGDFASCLTLQTLSLIGMAIFGIGFFLSEVGYGSKIATLIGAIILVAGSICIFADGNLDAGLRYYLLVDAGNGTTKEIINFSQSWLTVKLVAIIADGLTLINLIFVLLRRKRA
jgi:hypothetical protein